MRFWRHGLACSVALTVIRTSLAAESDAFPFGVSAGDVTDTAATLWTRAAREGAVRLELSTAADPANALRTIDLDASTQADLTLKIEITGLMPATDYVYRFIDAGGHESDLGNFKTAPAEDTAAALRFIFSGDSNFAFAPFIVMGAAAAETADFFLWDGDTIYGDVAAGGLGEAVTQSDYRAKYQQVRGDPGARALAAAMTAWATWDDHEVFNDYAGRDPAVPSARKRAGYRAFFEYMPIRPQNIHGDAFRIYRSFKWGTTAEFFLLDGRQYREREATQECHGNLDPDGVFLGFLSANPNCQTVLRAPRAFLGDEQLAWLQHGLKNSTARWKFIVNDVPFSYIGVLPYDRWDGYDDERRRILEFIDSSRIENVVILSTDIHANGFNPDVTRYFRANRPDYSLPNNVVVRELIAGPIGNQPAAGTITSIGGEFLEGLVANALKKIERISGFTFVDADKVSYVVLDVRTNGRAKLEYKGLSSAEITAGATAADVKTFYSDDLERAAPPVAAPCCLPGFGLTIAGLALHRAGVARKKLHFKPKENACVQTKTR